MKNPLHYQLSEYDCGPTTMLNAISFLFEREEISPVVIRNVMLYCLDSYNGEGIMGKSGTSSAAMILKISVKVFGDWQGDGLEKIQFSVPIWDAGLHGMKMRKHGSVRVTDQGLMHTGNFWITRLRKIFNKTVL